MAVQRNFGVSRHRFSGRPELLCMPGYAALGWNLIHTLWLEALTELPYRSDRLPLAVIANAFPEEPVHRKIEPGLECLGQSPR